MATLPTFEYPKTAIFIRVSCALAGVSLGLSAQAVEHAWVGETVPLAQKRYDVFAQQGLHETSLANDWRVGVLSSAQKAPLSVEKTSSVQAQQMGATAYLGKEWQTEDDSRHRWMIKAGSTHIEQHRNQTLSEAQAEAQMWRMQTEWSYKKNVDTQWAVEPYAEWTTQHLRAHQQGSDALWALPQATTSQHQTDVQVGTRVHYESSEQSHLSMGLGWQQVLSSDAQVIPGMIAAQPQMRWIDPKNSDSALRLDVSGAMQLTENSRLHVGYRVHLQAQDQQQSLSLGWTIQF